MNYLDILMLVRFVGYVVQFHIEKTNEVFLKYKRSDTLLIVLMPFRKTSYMVVGFGWLFGSLGG